MRELIGFLKSIVIYYNPLRYRRLASFYKELLHPGDLCFDIGAHVGNRTKAMLAAGASVVALEPQERYYRFLKRRYGSQTSVLAKAAGSSTGTMTLHRSPAHPTLATVSDDWMSKVKEASNWSRIEWSDTIEVETISLADLISEYGQPRYIKIDVEGFEKEVLSALPTAVERVSFEYMPADMSVAIGCIEILTNLGNYEYNIVVGEESSFSYPEWIEGTELRRYLLSLNPAGPSGDVHARIAH